MSTVFMLKEWSRLYAALHTVLLQMQQEKCPLKEKKGWNMNKVADKVYNSWPKKFFVVKNIFDKYMGDIL